MTTGTELARKPADAQALENVLIKGDLKELNEAERVMYYKAVCESVGLNPLTKPFDYILLNGRLTLYAKKDATDQLRNLHNVSITDLQTQIMEGVYIVKAHARNGKGREDTSTGAVNIKGLQGEGLANALMKAETKAKRRVTLSICGLGMLDETEVDSIPSAQAPTTQPRPAISTLEEPKISASAVQIKDIRRIVGDLGEYDRQWNLNHLCEALEIGALEDLTQKRASEVLRRLSAMLKEHQENEAAQGDTVPYRVVSQLQPKPDFTSDEGEATATAGAEVDELDAALAAPEPVAAPVTVGQQTDPDFDNIPVPEPITEKQLKAIYAVGKAKLRLSNGQLDDRCVELYGVQPSELTKNEASKWLTQMQEQDQSA